MVKFLVLLYLLSYISTLTLAGTMIIDTPIVDEKAINIRALHIVTRAVTPEKVKKIIDQANRESFNTIILGIAWGESTKLNSMPWVDAPFSWSREELLSVVNYARSKNMEVIPHIPLLSHQKVLLKKPFPELMYNGQTYDPRNPMVYDLVFPILDEVIELIHPKAIHIGHDEVVGWKAKHYEKGLLNPGEKILPANLFLADTMKLYNYLKSKRVETWMWGDMLISPEEFPTMRGGGLHGSEVGYGAALRSQIPKDIVIVDWHYNDRQKDFPSLVAFKKEGFYVLGSTWKKERTIRNFSNYAARNGADGMVSTIWAHLMNEDDEEVVDRIIRKSGEVFLEDFPDVKE